MEVRVFTRRVQLVTMVRVLDRAEAIAAPRQCLDQIDDQGGLAAVLTADDVKSFHGLHHLFRMRFSGCLMVKLKISTTGLLIFDRKTDNICQLFDIL